MTPEPSDDWVDLVAGSRPDPEAVRRLREAGRLTDAELRRLDTELALNRLLCEHRPPPTPSSNFTSRVLAEIAREARPATPVRPWWNRLGWVSRAAAFAALALVATVGWSQMAAHQRSQLAGRAAELGLAANVPGLDAGSLADFEVIRHIGSVPKAEDDALILALAQ